MPANLADAHLLLLGLAALGVGPLLHQLARAKGSLLAALDGFILVAMGGLVLVHIVPECYDLAGWPALAAVLVGLLGPGLVEHRLHGLARQAHAVALVLALAGLGLHAFLDGLALRDAGGEHGHRILPMAVILHRLPEGLTLWFLLRPYGPGPALGGLGLISAATVAGFGASEMALGGLANQERGLFQALVAGALLHVVWHRSYSIGETAATPGASRWHAGIGALGGLALMWTIRAGHLGPSGQQAGRVFLSLVVLVVLFLLSWWRQGPRAFAEEGAHHQGDSPDHHRAAEEAKSARP